MLEVGAGADVHVEPDEVQLVLVDDLKCLGEIFVPNAVFA